MSFPLRHPAALVLVAVGALVGLGLIESCSRSAAEGAEARDRSEAPPPASLPQAAPGFEIPRPPAGPLPVLTPDLPRDLAPSRSDASPEDLRRTADTFAWESFLALNWPALPDGSPDETQAPGQTGDNSTVWESWPEAAQVFLPAGRTPPPWGAFAPVPLPSVFASVPSGARVLIHGDKTFDAGASLVPQGPLIDQNGRHIRTEIRFNRPVFETLLARELYRRAGQSGADPVSFPGANPADAGSIRVQAAWKVLSPAEVAAGRFHSVEARLYTPASGDQAGPGSLETAVVGLVGLHIARKTPSAPDWIWFTFEHVDNCPTAGEPVDRAAYNFYDKTKPGLPANLPPPPPWNPALVEPAARRPQIVRQTPIPISTRILNATYQAALRAINPASVWQYYELVGTEHRPRSGAPLPAPARFANTTLETYLAARSDAPSCLECHAKAETAAQAPADFSFLLRLAR